MSDQLRLFVGVRVSMDTVARLRQTRSDLARAADEAEVAIRWVAPASYHVTLQFLGWARPPVVEALGDGVGEALSGVRGFRFAARGLGAFPEAGRARVVWAGLDDGGCLGQVAAKVGEATAALGFPREKRAYHPHVTLGRLKKVADVGPLLVPYAEQSFSETVVDSVILFESRMKSSGSEYVEVASWPLELPSKGAKRQTEGLDPSLKHREDLGDGQQRD